MNKQDIVGSWVGDGCSRRQILTKRRTVSMDNTRNAWMISPDESGNSTTQHCPLRLSKYSNCLPKFYTYCNDARASSHPSPLSWPARGPVQLAISQHRFWSNWQHFDNVLPSVFPFFTFSCRLYSIWWLSGETPHGSHVLSSRVCNFPYVGNSDSAVYQLLSCSEL